ncbi:MAG: rhodanese-related sulfurtransferase [Woeseia sp.]
MNVVSFYRFVDIAAPGQLRDRVQALCEERQVLGTVLLAAEGINGTIAGGSDSLQQVLDTVQTLLSLEKPLTGRWTQVSEAPFRRLRVRVKNEIVTLGRPDIRPQQSTGKHVPPDQWNTLIDDPQTLLIDTRNHYEVEVGTFPRAVDPGTDSFRQFGDFAAAIPAEEKKRPVAMFCTGGIRCEKASALMLELGFRDVYQLEGGILNYLQEKDPGGNRWQGECFVFDSRVAVDRDLAEGGYVQCHACRRPLSSRDLESPDYREGVSCPRCINELEEERAARLEERRRQVALARERGEKHIGAALPHKRGQG